MSQSSQAKIGAHSQLRKRLPANYVGKLPKQPDVQQAVNQHQSSSNKSKDHNAEYRLSPSREGSSSSLVEAPMTIVKAVEPSAQTWAALLVRPWEALFRDS
jgi:hypothetical protein